jgi:hypothetical protein
MRCGRAGKRCRTLENGGMTRLRMYLYVVAVGPVLGLSACTNPYDPVQRFIGGGLIGAGSGAAIGAAAAGGHGAALGAAIGGAVGAVGGLITTPPPPAHYGYYNHRQYSYYNRQHYASYHRRKHHYADCGQAVGSTATAQANAPSGY